MFLTDRLSLFLKLPTQQVHRLKLPFYIVVQHFLRQL